MLPFLTRRPTRPGASVLAALLAATAALAAPGEPPIPLARSAAEQARIAAVAAPPQDFDAPEPFEARPGGAATSFAPANRRVLAQPSATMPFENRMRFALGEALFQKLWVAPPASTRASDGLGPLYNARSCQSCHHGGGGRGPAPRAGDDAPAALFLRVSIPADRADGAPAAADAPFATQPDPVYGLQLQSRGVIGAAAEARLRVEHRPVVVDLAGGERVILRKPLYRLTDLGYGPLAERALLSPRLAPPIIGAGLLEAIPEDEILALADPEDADGDGISGRARRVWSGELRRPALGRFGLKAGAATVTDQTAAAFAGDMGLSNPLHPGGWGECAPAQAACRNAAHGESAEQGGFEVGAEALALTAFYARNLAPPARRAPGDPEILAGKRVFHAAGCAACHRPKHVTARFPAGERPEHSFQLIWPYTDLLLHDMGPGLADGRPEGGPEGGASGREWRTAPLWGIGLAKIVEPRAGFLHDGRARSLLEAVLWHGGEARPARDHVVALPKAERDALIRFLESL